jgi:hypothetical protein
MATPSIDARPPESLREGDHYSDGLAHSENSNGGHGDFPAPNAVAGESNGHQNRA